MFRIFMLLGLIVVLPGCTAVGVAAGLGATGGIAAAQEGGLTRAAKDAQIQIQINNLWFQYDVDTFRKLDMTVNQGRVLITGVVQDPNHRVEAVRLAWQPSGVQQVINEIQVTDSEGITGFAKDTWITTQLRTSLTFDREVLSINYSIDTVQGTVYLMGFAQSRAELNRVIEKARTTKGVKGVVSYVKLVGEETPSRAPSNNYQSTYNDDFVYRDESGRTAPMQGYDPSMQSQGEAVQITPYTDANGARAPQLSGMEPQGGGAGYSNAYPNNVEPIQDSSNIMIEREPLAPPPGQGSVTTYGWND